MAWPFILNGVERVEFLSIVRSLDLEGLWAVGGRAKGGSVTSSKINPAQRQRPIEFGLEPLGHSLARMPLESITWI